MIGVFPRQKAFFVIAVSLCTSFAASSVNAASLKTYKLSAKMDSRQVVVPRKPVGDVAQARGTFTGTLALVGGRWRLTWHLTFSQLGNPRLVVGDIHIGKPGKFGPIVLRVCGPCKSGQGGQTFVRAAAVSTITTQDTFMTLITEKNPNGVVRAQIKVT